MFKYNNTHIFTGYLKQLLASSNLPTCKIYTREFAKHLEQYGTEDPRVLESFDSFATNNAGADEKAAVRINYLRNNVPYNYFSKIPSQTGKPTWRKSADVFYTSDKTVRGLTRSLYNQSTTYDTETHEYLGEYLRFLRDYNNVDLMPLYNCFSNKIYNNIDFAFNSGNNKKAVFDSQDSSYKIYAIPVKLFASYTIAIDCSQEIEMFCGLYSTGLDMSAKGEKLASKTYEKVSKTLFKQPFLYEKLSLKVWNTETDFDSTTGLPYIDRYTRWDLTLREQNLRLFIKIPVGCRSSITILEGDYRNYNNVKYAPVQYVDEENKVKAMWVYQNNKSIMNFNAHQVDLNRYDFNPICQLQLLAFNTEESYPFSDKLVEYLGGSVITPLDPISDNVKRAQYVMTKNENYFRVDGLWENKMRNIIYDNMLNAGPFSVQNGKILDRRLGYNAGLGRTKKSTTFDVLGYIDKDAEKRYSSWKIENNKVIAKNNIQNVDIYDGLYDI